MSAFSEAELAYLSDQPLGRVATARCLEIRGHAETVDESPEGPLIRIHPERIISFGIDEPFTSPQDLTVNARNVHGRPNVD